jgi:conjugative relaxase-like TrwC/TraI family protein
VLSIGKLGQGQADYYLESVAQGIEDYYTGAGEAPGRWLGSAARELGMGGEVEDDDLHAVLNGLSPRTGDPLAAPHGGARVPGFDLTFSAPKSVSVAFELGDAEVTREVREAHELAVTGALDYMERHAAVARRGHGGVEIVPGNGFVAAAFRHRTSRAGDPQLHTHVLVANMTRGPDDRWTALDGRRVYAHAKTAGYLYQAQLRTELVRRLGVEWTQVHNGTAEIAGIPAPVLRAFSRRRIEIEQAMADRGDRSSKAAQVATLDSRRAKDYDVSPDSLRDYGSQGPGHDHREGVRPRHRRPLPRMGLRRDEPRQRREPPLRRRA